MHLSSMPFSRTTDSGRHITAVPRVRDEPDIDSLVALVLHLAEQLHNQEQRHRTDDRADEEGHDNDTPTPSNSSRS